MPRDSWAQDQTRLIPEARRGAGLSQAELAYLADCLHSLRRPAEAMPVLERAIAVADEVEGEDRRELHLSLALVFQDLGDLDRATNEAERALALAEVEYPEQTPRRARHLLAYARILRDRGQLRAAQAAARQSLELDEIGWSGKRSPHRNLDRDAILNGPHSR